MNCDRVQSLIDAYTTDELDLAATFELEQHLDGCATCAGALESLHALRRTLADTSLRYPAPPELRHRIGVHLGINGSAQITSTPYRSRNKLPAIAAAAAVAMLLLLPWLALYRNASRSAADQLATEITASHVRSMMTDHLLDVTSTDQHTVKPWFDGKLDFAPAVTDLSPIGFPLIGGRLDYVHSRAVAAIIYKRHQHVINLFTWPAPPPATDVEPAHSQHNGFNLVMWTRHGMRYIAVSDLNPQELEQFCDALRDSTTRPAATR